MQLTSKPELRKTLLAQRRSLSPKQWREKSDRLCDQLQSFPLFTQAKTILAYFSFRQEPDLSPLFANNYRWGFPRCVGEGASPESNEGAIAARQSLVWHRWQPGESLQTGIYGIKEPLPDAPIITATEVDLILVPTVACDWRGYRLGYGGGFYDRLLSSPEWHDIPTIGIVFDFAYLSQLPIDAWDIKLNSVCTENMIK